MRFHILNGDTLKGSFPFDHIAGEVIVIREAFIDGPVSDVYDAAYWSSRKNYFQKAYGKSEKTDDDHMIHELSRLQKIGAEDEVYLWFEDDLFCQCNMWFAVDYILQHSHPVFFRVFPEADNVTWMGFGRAGREDLIQYFNQAIKLSSGDVDHIDKLWKSYVDDKQAILEELSKIACGGIRFQKEMIQAQLDRSPDISGFGRPQTSLLALWNEGHQSFYQLYEKFYRQEGIYGFGDAQVRNMLKEMNINL